MKLADYIEVNRVDWRDREYADFHVRRARSGRGYEVYGRCIDQSWYDGKLIKICARPMRLYKNGRTRPSSWPRERDAYEFSLYLNGTDAGTIK